MEYVISLLPWLLPSLGACLMAALPPNKPTRIRRWGQTAILLSTSASLILIQGATPPESNASPFIISQLDTLAFAYGQWGTAVAWLLLVPLTITNIGLITEPLGRPEGARQLALAGATLATVAAANPFTLGVVWVLTDLMLAVLKLRSARQEGLHRLMHYGTGNLLSIMALIVAIVLMSGQEDALSPHIFAMLTPPAAFWLGLAAFLRLGVYPLPNRHGKMWEVDLASFGMGIYLWLQLSAMQRLGLVHLFTLIIALSLLAMSLLASRTAHFYSAWPYMSMHSILLSLLPMLMGGDAAPAATLSLAALWALCLGLRHLYIRASVQREIARWWRVPMMVALAALSGLPPTLGFTVRWALLRLCWRGGRWDVILAITVGSLLVSTMLWRQLEGLLAFHGDHERPKWPERVSLSAAALLAVALMVGGSCPPCLGRIWPGAGGLSLPFSESIVRGSILLLLTLIPSLGGYALHRMRALFPFPLIPRARSRRLEFIIGLEWLYGSVESALESVDRWLTVFYTTLEESLGLGWIVVWALALTLYLVGR